MDYHPGLDQPAASRYAATTPKLLRWFKTYNQNRLYRDQVRPFNFMLAFQCSPVCPLEIDSDIPVTNSSRQRVLRQQKPISPYNSDISKAAMACFDRETGSPVCTRTLKTYREALAQYHISPESKFLNGGPYDTGPTQQRHIAAIAIQPTGKEANRWEEQFHLGFDEGEQLEYGMGQANSARYLDQLSRELGNAGRRRIARVTGISRQTINGFVAEKSIRKELIAKLARSMRIQDREL